jgi:hypothetical protein
MTCRIAEKVEFYRFLESQFLLSLASHDVSLLDGAESESALEGPADSVASPVAGGVSFGGAAAPHIHYVCSRSRLTQKLIQRNIELHIPVLRPHESRTISTINHIVPSVPE